MRYPRGSLTAEIAYRLRRPRLAAQGVNVLYYKLLERLGELPDGIDVVDREWDNLVILDACRYDSFTDAVGDREALSGELSRVYSKGPYTNEFLYQNFHERELHDVVYVTTSPHLYKSYKGERREIDADLHEEIHVWKESYDPEDTTEAAVKAAENYPNKRLIVHYLPPHTPLLGEDLFAEFEGAPYEEMLTGEVDIGREAFDREYHRNLEIGLDNVEELLPHLDGKTVVTADHGQLLGDREFPIPVRGYGHPGLYMDELVAVPWLELPFDERRETVAEPPAHSAVDAEEAAEAALRDLGYL